MIKMDYGELTPISSLFLPWIGLFDEKKVKEILGFHTLSRKVKSKRKITGAIGMCRNIKTLYNFDPPATGDEIRAAALQYVRKVSGFAKPSAANEAAFNRAVVEVEKATSRLLSSLVTAASPKNREVEAARAHARAERRFGPTGTVER